MAAELAEVSAQNWRVRRFITGPGTFSLQAVFASTASPHISELEGR